MGAARPLKKGLVQGQLRITQVRGPMLRTEPLRLDDVGAWLELAAAHSPVSQAEPSIRSSQGHLEGVVFVSLYWLHLRSLVRVWTSEEEDRSMMGLTLCMGFRVLTLRMIMLSTWIGLLDVMDVNNHAVVPNEASCRPKLTIVELWIQPNPMSVAQPSGTVYK